MSDPVKDYVTASDGFSKVLAQAGSLDIPSPCEGWTAQDIVDHVVGGTSYYTEAFGGTLPEVADDAPVASRYDAFRVALADTCAQPGALERPVDNPIGEGEIPAGTMLGIYTMDTLIHTWDLAKALGLDVTLDADLLQRTLDDVQPLEAVLRSPGILGPAVDVPADAPLQDRALGFFGRQP
jgi:uncharacterized protein (TIGR03086 family)